MVAGAIGVRITHKIINKVMADRARKELARIAQRGLQDYADSLRVRGEHTGGEKYQAQLRKDRPKEGTFEISVGILGGKHLDGETNLAEIAAIHEYGSRDERIPERPAFRAAQRRAKGIIQRAAHEGRLHDAETLGEELASDLKETVRDLRIPKNRPSTLRDKRGTNPLIDSEALVDGIRYRVERR